MSETRRVSMDALLAPLEGNELDGLEGRVGSRLGDMSTDVS